MATRPNILLLMSDQHRADILGAAGDPVIQTPHLDGLAARGTRFTDLHCQGPLCMPARASFLTERYVRDHGVFENRWDTPTELPTFLHELQEVGYHTSCIGKMHLWVHGAVAARSRARATDTREMVGRLQEHGFTEPIETVGKLASVGIGTEYGDHLRDAGLLETYQTWVGKRMYGTQGDKLPNWSTGSIPLPTESYIDAWHGDRVVRWIEEYDRDEPWFLWVGFPGPHDPWDAPAEYVDRYRDTTMPMPASLERPTVPESGPWKDFLSYFLWHHSDSEGLDDDRIQEVRRHYYADLTVIDDAVGKILAALERTGQADETWIIYTSDHGEMMGEHRMLMKMVFYDQATRVPLIVTPPEGTASKVVEGLAEHFDVSATVRSIAGAGAHDTFEGRSLLDGEVASAPGRDAVWSENYGFGMVRTDRHKLVFGEDTLTPHQFFDLAADPTEEQDLIDDPGSADVVEDLMETRVRPFLAGGRTKFDTGVFES